MIKNRERVSSQGELAKNSLVRGCIYVHYKGGTYTALFTAYTHNHNGDIDVVYVSHTTGDINTRCIVRDSRNEDAWTELVDWPDNKKRARFTHVSGFQPSELDVLAEIWAMKDEEKK